MERATKKKLKKIQLQIPESLHAKMQAIADDLTCSMNAWAVRALAYGVKNHVPFEEYINQAPTRGKGKQRQAFGRLSPFNGLLVDELGVPEGVNLPDGELELFRQLKEGGEPGLKRFMQTLWDMGKIGQEYTDAHLSETLRVLTAEE